MTKKRTITALTSIKTILNKQVESFKSMSVDDLSKFEDCLNKLNEIFNKAQEERSEEIIKAKEEELNQLKAKFKK